MGLLIAAEVRVFESCVYYLSWESFSSNMLYPRGGLTKGLDEVTRSFVKLVLRPCN